MEYVSTRGQAPTLAFDDVLLTGLAVDGGLYVPAQWPKFSRSEIRDMRGLGYADLAFRIMRPYIGDTIGEDDFAQIVQDSYAGFDHQAVAPLKQLGGNRWLLELFHGPTLAFKDYPLQLVGRLFDHVLKKRGQNVTIIGATSGDTGSAAIEACRDRDAVELFIFHPKGRVSEVQRRQMTTVMSANVHNIALDGTFDDCQDMVKNLFAEDGLRDRFKLSAVNSINWARIMAQIVYYFYSSLSLGAPDRKIAFAVPTGNFGNVYAGFAARKMGLPIEHFIVGSNANDILTRYLNSGIMEMAPVKPTLSPSMDIQISSNFERLLFDYYHGNGLGVAKAMNRFRRIGSVNFGKSRWRSIQKSFSGFRVGDNATKSAISEIFDTTGELVDPHTAIGIAAGGLAALAADCPIISMATAHPAKFPAAVEEATGVRPELPPKLADLFERKERFSEIANNKTQAIEFIADELAERNLA